MDLFPGRGIDVRRRFLRPFLLPLVVLSFVLAACTGTASSQPSSVASDGAASVTPAVSTSPVTSAPASGPASGSPAIPAPTYPLALTDDEGNNVALPAEPQKIVSLTPATTEIVYALGAGDRLVATTNFDDYPPQAKALPHVATYTSVDVEKIVGLGADLVLAGGNSFNPPASLDKLRSLKIPVLVVYAPTVDGVLKDIDLVGSAIGESAAATALTDQMSGQIAAIRSATAPLAHPRTFYELDATKDIYGPADKSFVAEMVQLAGGTPITTGSTTVFSIPLEKLLAADPEVIVMGDADYGVTASAVAARPGWAGMTAVKDGAVRPVDDIIVTRPGPRLVQGLIALAKAIHPDATLPSIP